MEDAESFEQAACREASEELGVHRIKLHFLWEAVNDFVHVDQPVRQRECYFLLEDAGQELLRGVQAIHQQEGILEARWWTRSELQATTEPVFPEDLATRLTACYTDNRPCL